MIRRLRGFEYRDPTSMQEAIGLFEQHGPKCRVVGGGTDFLVAMKEGRVPPPPYLVSLRKIPGISGIGMDEGRAVVTVRAGTTISEILESSVIQSKMPLLVEAGKVLGSPQVRNRATLGGNICNASPAADMVLPLIAYGASGRWIGPEGEKAGLLEEFFRGPGSTVLKAGEFLWEVEIPLRAGQGMGVYRKLGKRKGMEIAVVNVAVLVGFSSEGTCSTVRIVLGSVSPTAMRARGAEAHLVGKGLTPELMEEAGKKAAMECKPISDLRASGEYRREMVEVLVRRSLQEVLERRGRRSRGEETS